MGLSIAFHFTLLMIFALLVFALSDEFSRTICLCEKDRCYDPYNCDSSNTVNPFSPTFIDDLNIARNNIKNINLVLKASKQFEMKIDLRLLSGLNITFEAYVYEIPITFIYDSNLDYKGTLLYFNFNFFRKRFAPIFVPVDDKTPSNDLRLDTLYTFGQPVTFCKKGEISTSLYYNNLNMAASSLENISSLLKLHNGVTNFSTLSKQSFEVLISKTEKKFKFNGNNINISTLEGDSIILKASMRTKVIEDTSFKLTIDKDFPDNEIPFLTFNNFTHVEIYGKLWKPSETRPINQLYDVTSLIIPPGDVPLAIYSLTFEMTVSGDATIYGDIHKSSGWKTNKMNITSLTNAKSKVVFKELVSSEIYMRSPYVDIEVMKFYNPNADHRNFHFPIAFCFNEEVYSHVIIKKFVDSRGKISKKKLYSDHLRFYSTITTVYTDDELKKIKIFKDGFTFLDFPLDLFATQNFVPTVEQESPSVQNVIPGFTTSSFCLGITYSNTDSFRLSAKLNKSAYGTTMNLCFLTDTFLCDNSLDNPFISINRITYDGNISRYVSKGYKDIYITASGTDFAGKIVLDFDTLQGDGYNVSIISNKYRRDDFQIKVGPNKIKYLFIAKSNISGGANFDIPIIYIRTTKFNHGDTFIFSDSTKVFIDVYSIGYVLNSSENVKLKDFTIDNDMYYITDMDYFGVTYFNIVDTIDVNDRAMKICMKLSYVPSYPTTPTTKAYCSDIDLQSFTKLPFYSQNSLEFNVITFPANIDKLSIFITPRKNLLNYTVSLKGVGWSTKLDKKINVNYGHNKIRIAVTNPGQADNLNFIGNGSKHFTINYVKPQKYCIYDIEANTTCYSNTSISTKMIENDENLINTLQSIENVSIQLTIDNSKNSINIPFSYLNLKQIIFKTTPKSEKLSKIMIDFTETKKIDLNYSMTVFDGVDLDYSSASDVEVEFGQVRIDSALAISSGWTDHVSLTVSQLVCDYSYLKQFKKLTIDDQLNLTGDISSIDRDIVVEFKKDDDPNDLVAELSGEVTINVGVESLKVGHLELKITHSENYDAYFVITSDSNITIISDANANEDTFPKFVVDTGKNNCSFIFKGSFPTIDEKEESYIKIFGTGKTDISFSGFLPLSISGLPDVCVRCLGETNTIQGPIDYIHVSKSEPGIKFYNDNKKKATLSVVQGINIKKINGQANFTGVMSSNLQVTIKSLTYTNVSQSSISIFSTISNTSSSKIIFESDFPDNLELSDIHYVTSDVFGIMESEKDFIFVKKPEIIIQANSNDIAASYSFEYIRDDAIEGRTHGFYWTMNCLGINSTLTADVSGIQLFAAILPSHVPFIVDIVSNKLVTTGEISIDYEDTEKLKNLKDLLPNEIDGARIRLFTDMSDGTFIDIDQLADGHSQFYFSIESIGESRYDAFTTIPSAKDVTLYFRNVNLGVSSSSNKLAAKFINFTDCDFVNAGLFQVTESISELVLDVDSLNGLVSAGSLKSFNNMLHIHSANVIVFNESGWQFTEDLARPSSFINAKDFTKVTFETNKFCQLMVGDDVKSAIHGFTLNSYSVNNVSVLFEMNAGWGRIKDLGCFNVKVHNAGIVLLNSASYPIPKIFDMPEENISYTFETDINGDFETITLKDGTYNDEKMIMNFLFLPPDYQFINANKIKLGGNSEFRFQNDVGTVQVNEIELLDGSNVKISNLKVNKQLTLDRNSFLNASIAFDQSSKVTIKWTLDQKPLVIHNKEPGIYPRTLQVVYEGSDVDRDRFRETMIDRNGLVLMKGNFKCLKMKEYFEFASDFKQFGKDNSYLSLICDTSQSDQILLLRGNKDIDDGDDSQIDDGGKSYKVSPGGITGIVIVCMIVCIAATALIVYVIQKKKIDELKNEIPRGTVEV